MAALRPRIACTSCNVTRRVEGTHALCDHCALDAKAIRDVVRLVIRRFPGMAECSTPEIFLRLWMHFGPIAKDRVALDEARTLSADIAMRVISEPPKSEDPEAHEVFRRARIPEVSRARSRKERKI